MKRLLPALLIVFVPLVACAQTESERVSSVLDRLHAAASDADIDAYSSVFSEGAVFLGTDSWERWPQADFMEYAASRFNAGNGWTYHMLERNITIAPGGEVAWFDEALENENMGLTRGTGVLVLEDGEWRISQYSLSVPIPNEQVRAFVALMRVHRGN